MIVVLLGRAVAVAQSRRNCEVQGSSLVPCVSLKPICQWMKSHQEERPAWTSYFDRSAAPFMVGHSYAFPEFRSPRGPSLKEVMGRRIAAAHDPEAMVRKYTGSVACYSHL